MINANLIQQFESLRDEIIEGLPENAVEWLEIAIKNLKEGMPVNGEDEAYGKKQWNRMDRGNMESDRRMFGNIGGLQELLCGNDGEAFGGNGEGVDRSR